MLGDLQPGVGEAGRRAPRRVDFETGSVAGAARSQRAVSRRSPGSPPADRHSARRAAPPESSPQVEPGVDRRDLHGDLGYQLWSSSLP